MLIGELAAKTKLSRDTIRFYEKHGLIQKGEQKGRFNNYKDYPEETLQRLLVIKKIKRFGFTLNEISSLLDLIDINQATCKNVAEKFNEKIKLLDDKIQELIAIKTTLIDGMMGCEGYNDPEKMEGNCGVLREG